MSDRVRAGRDRLLTPRFLLVVLAGICYFMGFGVLVPTVPKYAHEVLGAGSVGVGIAVGSLAIGAIMLRPIAGRIGDHFGRRVLLIGGALMVGMMTACSGIIESLPWLSATRVLLGLGEAAFFVGITTMITDLAPVTRRGEAVSYLSVATWGGLSLGPLLGQLVLDGSHYQRVWSTAAGLAVAAALVGFMTLETHVRTAMPFRGRLVHPAAIRPGILMMLSVLGLMGFQTFVVLYAPTVGVHEVAPIFLVHGLTVVSVRVLFARLPDQLGPRRAGSIAMFGLALGLAIVAAWQSPTGIFVGVFCIALGGSFLYPALMVLALSGIPDDERGSVVGTFSAFFDLTAGCAGLVLGAIVAFSSYATAFAVSSGLALTALVLLRTGFGREHERLTGSPSGEPVGRDAAPAAGV